MDRWVTIVVILVICGLVNGAIAVSPVTTEARKWAWAAVLLATAGFFGWRFL